MKLQFFYFMREAALVAFESLDLFTYSKISKITAPATLSATLFTSEGKAIPLSCYCATL